MPNIKYNDSLELSGISTLFSNTPQMYLFKIQPHPKAQLHRRACQPRLFKLSVYVLLPVHTGICVLLCIHANGLDARSKACMCPHTGTWEIKIYLCLYAANCRHAAMCPTHKAGCWESDKAKLPPLLHAHTHMCVDSVNRPVREAEPWQSLIHHQDYCTVIYALSTW